MTRSLHTIHLDQLVQRHQQEDSAAFEELLELCFQRIERLTSKMLSNYPGVARHEQTGDILSNAVIRLRRALESVRPASTRDFFCLAAEQIRRELVDRARYYQRRPKLSVPDLAEEAGAPALDPQDIERWTSLHESIEKLPTRERETFMLVFYQGWAHAQIAELFEVSVRQVGRWWAQACLLLHDLVQGEIPL